MSARPAKNKAIVDVTRLTGPEKAAVVLLSLGEDHAGVWRQLDEEEIKVISQAMAGLGQVTASVVEDLLWSSSPAWAAATSPAPSSLPSGCCRRSCPATRSTP